MSMDMPEIEAYAAALLEEIKQGLEAGCSVTLTNRRMAALAELHALLDPWQPCRCEYCAFHARLSPYFSGDM